jgi:haloacetate dehalogenase
MTNILYEQVNGCNIAYNRTGTGYPLLLLHGFPQTHVAWHEVAPLLADNFTLIIPDLPGYGDSTGPAPDEQHEAYSKRNLGNLLVTLMKQLGFTAFAVAGHDRGGRVGYRMAFDHPGVVKALAVLDIIPTGEMADRMDFDLAVNIPHWWLLAQPHPFPETLMLSNAEFYLKHTLESWSGKVWAITDKAWQEYLRCFKKPEVIRAMCEDYRAGASIDVEHDRASKRKGERITCPVFVLYPEEFFAARFGHPVEVWQQWAKNVQGTAVQSSHFLMEEIPELVAAELAKFFSEQLA